MQRTFHCPQYSGKDTITVTDRILHSKSDTGAELYVELNPPGQKGTPIIIQVGGVAIGLSDVELYCLRKLLA